MPAGSRDRFEDIEQLYDTVVRRAGREPKDKTLDRELAVLNALLGKRGFKCQVSAGGGLDGAETFVQLLHATEQVLASLRASDANLRKVDGQSRKAKEEGDQAARALVRVSDRTARIDAKIELLEAQHAEQLQSLRGLESATTEEIAELRAVKTNLVERQRELKAAEQRMRRRQEAARDELAAMTSTKQAVRKPSMDLTRPLPTTGRPRDGGELRRNVVETLSIAEEDLAHQNEEMRLLMQRIALSLEAPGAWDGGDDQQGAATCMERVERALQSIHSRVLEQGSAFSPPGQDASFQAPATPGELDGVTRRLYA